MLLPWQAMQWGYPRVQGCHVSACPSHLCPLPAFLRAALQPLAKVLSGRSKEQVLVALAALSQHLLMRAPPGPSNGSMSNGNGATSANSNGAL